MTVFSPAVGRHVAAYAPAIAASVIDYSHLLGQSLGDLDLFDHRDHLGTVRGFELVDRIASLGGALTVNGLRPGDRVVMVAANTDDYLTTLLAVLALGAVPCAVAPPPTPDRPDSAGVRHLQAAIEVVDPRLVIADPRHTVALKHSVLLDYGELTATQPIPWNPRRRPEPGDIHHIQLTSGSTAAPKAVALSHGNVAHNIGVLSYAIGTVAGARMFSWLPMYHDMGFVQVLGALIHRSPIALMSPLAFLRDPLAWLRHMSVHGSTVSAAPPFAYRLATQALRRSTGTPKMDLTSLRDLFVGAEPIPYPVLRDFTDTFAAFGLRPGALIPCYGMAESVLATTLATRPAPRAPGDFGRVRVLKQDPGAAPMVSCGSPIDGMSIRIVDGEIQISGPSVMLGYLNRDGSLTRPPDGWHHTGDLGVLRGDELFVVGRRKEMVIVRGRNYPPYDIERAIENLPVVSEGNAVVFSSPDPSSGAEKVIAVVGTQPAVDDDSELRAAVGTAVRQQFGFTLDQVVLVPRGRIPRTTSGKIQRLAVRERYLAGEL